MRNVYIYSHNQASRSAGNLATELNVKRIKHTNSRFRGSEYKTVINWGSSAAPPQANQCILINQPHAVATAQNKLLTYRVLEEAQVNIPLYTEDFEQALEWATSGFKVVARTLLRGSAGRGIILVENAEQGIPPAPLYTRYIKKIDEYRVHVFQGRSIDIQKKAKKRDVPNEDVNYQIRTHDNGFIYMREGIQPPEGVVEQAINAVEALELDFGAVDVIWNNHEERAYVLEVNTAPGLEGTTVSSYADAIRQAVG